MVDVGKLIEAEAAKEGYDVVKVTPEYENYLDAAPKLIGLKVDLKRKPVITSRKMTASEATRDWFDINDR
jgi:hypothetical protein